MPRIAKADVNAALQRAATNIRNAAGADGRTSRAEMKEVLKGLSGTEKKLTDIFFKFIDHRDFKAGAQVTATDVSRAVAYAKDKLIAKYDLNNNGLSPAEIKKMSLTGKLSVDLARELKTAAGTSALDSSTHAEFFEKVKVTRGVTVRVEDLDAIRPELANQIITACREAELTVLRGDRVDLVKTLDEAFEAIDHAGFTVQNSTDKRTGAKYVSVDFGAGDNTYGAIFKAETLKVVALLRDGELTVQ